MHMQLAALKRQRSSIACSGQGGRRGAYFPVEAFEQLHEPPESAPQHDAAAALGRKPAIVQVVAIERDQGAPELSRQTIVLAVARAPQVVVLDHEQDVPREAARMNATRPEGMLAST